MSMNIYQITYYTSGQAWTGQLYLHKALAEATLEREGYILDPKTGGYYQEEDRHQIAIISIRFVYEQ